MKVTTVGLDLAKNVFQVHGTDEHGARVFNRQLRRSQMVEFFARLEPCTVGMEACASAHHWARTLQGLGHRVKLIPAQYVKAYLRGQKNDMRDAAAIAEATRCPTMSQVALKTEAQQAVFALHRQRALLMKMRTAQANQLRSLLAEFGQILPLGVQRLQRELPLWLDAQRLPEALVTMLRTGLEMLKHLGEQLRVLDRAIAAEHTRSAVSQRLARIAGVGVLSATALAAQLGNAQGYARSRAFSASLGLTPRQHSSGGQSRLGSITKHGDRYLRTLLIHGARAAILALKRKQAAGQPLDRTEQWATRLLARAHPNKVCTAWAAKNARIAWALVAHQRDYLRPDPVESLSTGA